MARSSDWSIQASCQDTSPSKAIAWAFPAHADGYPTGSGPGALVISVNVQVDDGLAIGIGGDTWTYVCSWQQ